MERGRRVAWSSKKPLRRRARSPLSEFRCEHMGILVSRRRGTKQKIREPRSAVFLASFYVSFFLFDVPTTNFILC